MWKIQNDVESSGGNGHGAKGEHSGCKIRYPSKKDGRPVTGKVSSMGNFGFKCVQVVDTSKKIRRLHWL